MKKILILSMLLLSVTALNAQSFGSTIDQSPTTSVIEHIKAAVTLINKGIDVDKNYTWLSKSVLELEKMEQHLDEKQALVLSNAKMMLKYKANVSNIVKTTSLINEGIDIDRNYLQLEQHVSEFEQLLSSAVIHDKFTAYWDLLLSNAKTMLYKKEYNNSYPFYNEAKLIAGLEKYAGDIMDVDGLNLKQLVDAAEEKMNMKEVPTKKEKQILADLFPYYVEKINVKPEGNIMEGKDFEIQIFTALICLESIISNFQDIKPNIDALYYYSNKLFKIIDLSAGSAYDVFPKISKDNSLEKINDLKIKIEGLRVAK